MVTYIEKDQVAVPLLDLKAQYNSIRTEVQAAVERVLESQYFIMGPEVKALEQEVAAYSQCHYGIGVSSGTDALLVALMAIDLKAGDEIITTPYTFFATAGCISRLGAKPVFVDIDPSTYNLNPAQVEALITPRTRAIIPVHLYGQMADMDPLMEIAAHHNLVVIEDAAQAIGAEYKGQRAGSIGHLGCFSFFPSKNLGGIGDGGMVVTNDAELASRCDLLRRHGSHPKYYHQIIGGNFRLDAIQATVLRVKLKYLDGWTQARQQNANRYRQLFTDAALVRHSADGHAVDDGILLPAEGTNGRHIYNQFVIRSSRRDELMDYLKQHKIGTEVYYPVPMHLQECFAELNHGRGDFIESEKAAEESLALPIYPELSDAMLTTVVDVIAHFYDH